MAQSDVIVSNKQGINFAGGKNRLGLFSTATASVADPRFFGTEPLRQIKAALVEWCKNALLLGGMHFERALNYFEQGDGFSTQRLRTMVTHSLEQKFAIAELDPGERKYGLILEYGHTVGHALEYLAQGRLLHGEAVFHGMRVAGRLANAMGLMPEAELAKQEKLLSHLLCIPSIPPEISVAQILQSVRKDNKKENKGHSFVLLKAIGDPHRHGESVMIPVQEETLQQVLLDYRDSLL
jgi:3-dehydroquinate synthetase